MQVNYIRTALHTCWSKRVLRPTWRVALSASTTLSVPDHKQQTNKMKKILVQDRKPDNQMENFDHLSFILSGDVQVCMSQELLPAQIAITLGNKGTLWKVPCAPHKAAFKTVLPSSTIHWDVAVQWGAGASSNGFLPFFVCTPVYSSCWTRKSIWGKSKMTDRRLDFLTTCQLSCSSRVKSLTWGIYNTLAISTVEVCPATASILLYSSLQYTGLESNPNFKSLFSYLIRAIVINCFSLLKN